MKKNIKCGLKVIQTSDLIFSFKIDSVSRHFLKGTSSFHGPLTKFALSTNIRGEK